MAEGRPVPWILVPPGQLTAAGSELRLGRTESRHLLGSLRRRTGDPVVLADGHGTVAAARLTGATRECATLTIKTNETVSQGDGAATVLAMAVLQGQAMDWAVQKAVEIGVRQLIPVLCERCQPSAAVAGRRLEHWRRVGEQAIKQCHRPWFMEVVTPIPLSLLVEQQEPGVVADQQGEPLAALPARPRGPLLIGPEGGLTDTEQQLLSRAGWFRLRLGRYILRAETAAAIGAALLETARAGDM